MPVKIKLNGERGTPLGEQRAVVEQLERIANSLEELVRCLDAK